MSGPVAALFAAFRKALGRAEDKRETMHRAAWELPIVVEPDPLDGGFVSECPDVPGAMAQGDTEREAIENLVEVIKTVLEVRMEQHLESIDFDVQGKYAVTGRSFSVPM